MQTLSQSSRPRSIHCERPRKNAFLPAALLAALGCFTNSAIAGPPNDAIAYVDANDNAPIVSNDLADTMMFGYALQSIPGPRETVDLANFLLLSGPAQAAPSAALQADDSTPQTVTLTGRENATNLPAANLPHALVDPGVGNLALEVDPTTGHVFIVGNNTSFVAYNSDSAGGLFNIAAGKHPYLTLKDSSFTIQSWNVIQAVQQHIAENATAATPPTPEVLSAFGSSTGNWYFDLTLPGSSLWSGGVNQVNSDLAFDWGDGNNAHHVGQVINLVPEPTTLGFLGIGALGLLARRRRQVYGIRVD